MGSALVAATMRTVLTVAGDGTVLAVAERKTEMTTTMTMTMMMMMMMMMMMLATRRDLLEAMIARAAETIPVHW